VVAALARSGRWWLQVRRRRLPDDRRHSPPLPLMQTLQPHTAIHGLKNLRNFEARACIGLQKNLDFINKNVRLD